MAELEQVEEAEALEGAEAGNDGQGEEQPQLSEVDKLAVELGWKPKHEWDGPEDGWTDSAAYLRKSREMSRSLSRELKDMRREVANIGKANAAMTQRALQEQRERLLQEREEAIEMGDKEAFNKAEKKLQSLDDKQPEGPSEAAQEFAERNASWFNSDDEATSYAYVRADYYQRKGITDPEKQLAKVEEDVRKRFPEHFEAPKPPKNVALGAASRSSSPAPREKGYGTLPNDARKACEEHVRVMKENEGWDDARVAKEKANWAKFYYAQEAVNG